MNRYCNRLVFAMAALVATCALALPNQARADLELRFSLDGGATFSAPTTTVSNPGTLTSTFVINGATFTATVNSLMGPTALLDLGVSGIANPLTTFKLIVEATLTNVTNPPIQSLSWKFSSSSGLTGLTETGEGFIDINNAAFGGATGGPAPGSIINTGLLTAPSTGSIGFSTSPPFSWTVQYNLTGTTDGTPQIISADDAQTLTGGHVPEPTSLFVFLSAIPVLGAGYWLRQRRLAA